MTHERTHAHTNSRALMHSRARSLTRSLSRSLALSLSRAFSLARSLDLTQLLCLPFSPQRSGFAIDIVCVRFILFVRARAGMPDREALKLHSIQFDFFPHVVHHAGMAGFVRRSDTSWDLHLEIEDPIAFVFIVCVFVVVAAVLVNAAFAVADALDADAGVLAHWRFFAWFSVHPTMKHNQP
jgi:hypothetical protein